MLIQDMSFKSNKYEDLSVYQSIYDSNNPLLIEAVSCEVCGFKHHPIDVCKICEMNIWNQHRWPAVYNEKHGI